MFIDLDTSIPMLENRGHTINDPWDVVDIFEKEVADYAGSKYAVSVDNCTDALFLCLKYLKAVGEVTIPQRTYMSVPATIIAAGCKVNFVNKAWSGVYSLSPYPIIDGATRFTKDMYEKDTYHCLSFHKKKLLSIGKGGMILTDDKVAYEWFRLARYSGRDISVPFKDMPEPTVLGWNMYMPPEQAALGLELFYNMEEYNEDMAGSEDYPDLSLCRIYYG
jgi:dTDP-4-amino-4,6-dideoxygalactose transaminase